MGRKQRHQRNKGSHQGAAPKQQLSPTPPPVPVADAGNAIRQEQANITPAPQGQPQRPRWWRSVTRFWFPLIVAAAAAVQAIVSYYQWSALQDQNAVMLEQNAIMAKQSAAAQETLNQMKVDQRPWIVLDEPQEDGNVLSAGKPSSTTFAMRNTGKTPAYIKEVSAFSVALAKDVDVTRAMTDPHRYSGRRGMELLLAPGENKRYLVRDTGSLSVKGIEELRSGALIYYVIAEIVYADSNGIRHMSRSCWSLDRTLHSFVDYPKHNKMD